MPLATIDNLKEYLGDAGNNKDDVLLTRLVNAATSMIEAYCGRTFAQTTYTNEFYDGNGTDVLTLRHWPIITVSALKEGGGSITTGTDPSVSPSPDALIYAEEGQLIRPAFTWFPYRRWYSVTYSAGYATIPASIVQACVELAGLMLKHKEHVGLQSKTQGSQTTSYISELPEYSQRALDLFRDAATGRAT